MFDLEGLTTDNLEQLITTLEHGITQARAAQIAVIAELDKRQVATGDGCRSLTDWISSRLDMRHELASELLTASKAMPESLRDELGQGMVSFDRAITETRMHTSGVSEDTIRESRGFDLAGARRLAGRHRRIGRHQERMAFRNQQVLIQPSLDGDGWRMFASMDGFEGSIIEKAILARSEQLADGMAIPHGLRMVLALTTICQDSLYEEADHTGNGDPIVTITADAALLLQTDGEAGAEITAGPRIGAMTLQELLCVGKAELNIKTADGNLMGVGKTTTSLPPRLRRAVISRDSGCVIDGCTSRYRLEIHHVVERSAGGTDDPSNLATLCWAHHHVFIHRRGHTIDPNSPPDRRRLRPPKHTPT